MNNTLKTMAVALALAALGVIAAAAQDAPAPKLTLKQVLDTALDDEYKAEAFYAQVIAEHGEVRPFSNIIHAEQRHAQFLLDLYEAYGLTTPDNAWTEHKFEFSGLEDAARKAREAEIENGEMYAMLLGQDLPDDVRATLENLKWASEERHLPAFERYLGMEPSGGQGMGKGQGRGNGGCQGGACMGQGQGKGNGQGGCQGGQCGNGQGNGKGKGQGQGKARGNGNCGAGGCGRNSG